MENSKKLEALADFHGKEIKGMVDTLASKMLNDSHFLLAGGKNPRDYVTHPVLQALMSGNKPGEEIKTVAKMMNQHFVARAESLIENVNKPLDHQKVVLSVAKMSEANQNLITKLESSLEPDTKAFFKSLENFEKTEAGIKAMEKSTKQHVFKGNEVTKGVEI